MYWSGPSSRTPLEALELVALPQLVGIEAEIVHILGSHRVTVAPAVAFRRVGRQPTRSSRIATSSAGRFWAIMWFVAMPW